MNEMGKHILIIDDDKDICDVISIVLEFNGYTTTQLLSGVNAANCIKTLQPDLILVDVMLDGIEGRDICRETKEGSGTSHIPIIMISASHNLNHALIKDCKPDDLSISLLTSITSLRRCRNL
jgi:DNA-binding response OmpR family regulator